MSGHVSVENAGVEFSTGSLGHGLPVACGIAKSFKLLREKIMFSVLLAMES